MVTTFIESKRVTPARLQEQGGREGKHLILMRALANLENSVYELGRFLDELRGGEALAPKGVNDPKGVPCFTEIYSSIVGQIDNNSSQIIQIRNELRDILL